ncbi:unnamed protein product [Plutella xylostella]|uniref:(diamondback moth) hypothetical protein n=1 Tax=Plutella xylostella TaxID=51655 RepID=A0A8S4GC73_PLUXY|nr:unnamed protein product [Plutella xylostella]
MAARILVFLLLCLCGVRSDGNIGADLFCIDPDDGSSHPVNSTWLSSTFCGKYTCKIRKKHQNNTRGILPKDDSNSIPDSIKPIDINNLRNDQSMDQSHAGSDTQVVYAKPPANMSPYPILHKEKKLNTDKDKTSTIKYIHEKIMNSIHEKDDRYLTEGEINTISELLHTVKKSDLETMAEIYSLAKDIFKEMDAKPDQAELSKVEDEVNNKIYESTKSKSVPVPKKTSYFYEPLVQKNSYEMKDMASHTVPSVIPTPAPYVPHPVAHAMPYYNQINYQPQPYHPYVPIPSPIPPQSNIQNTYSYRHPITAPPFINTNNYHREQNSSCSHFPFTHGVVKTPFPVEPAEVNQKPALMPYPFSYVYRHDLRPQYVYYNPFEQFDNRNPPVPSYAAQPDSNQQNYAKPFEAPNVNAVAKDIDDDVETDINDVDSDEDLVQRILPTYKKSQDRKLQPWQTEELSSQILNDIRANLTNKKPSIFPVKKMRLERIGKVIKLDDFLRVKRSVHADDEREDLNEEYEAFVDKITCPISTELGFFRMGDLSLPFPECCPQKIATHTNT